MRPGAPTPVQFKSASELIDNLQRPELGEWVDTFLANPRLTVPNLVRKSVVSNTFRAFPLRKYGLQPSRLYWEWTTDYLQNHNSVFLNAESPRAYNDAVIAAAVALEGHWLTRTEGRHSVGFGRAAKMLNLSLKHLTWWDGLDPSDVPSLWNNLHVPLDSYTVQGVASFAPPTLGLKTGGTMNSVRSAQQYQDTQEWLREICGRAGVPPIQYEVLAYNLAHPSTAFA